MCVCGRRDDDVEVRGGENVTRLRRRFLFTVRNSDSSFHDSIQYVLLSTVLAFSDDPATALYNGRTVSVLVCL